MPKSLPNGTKSRLLFLLQYLWDHTDDDHPVTTSQLLDLYHAQGYKSHRLTIPDDITALRTAGIDVITTPVQNASGSYSNAFHLGSRLFELAELRMLVDAVSSSRFITAEKSDLLVSKLVRLTNEENRASLTSQVCNADRLKTTNPNIFVSMDTIRRAIDEKRKISFHYWDYTPRKERILRHNGETYVASPYALIWNDDRYYVAAWSDMHDKLIKFRVDRMCDVDKLDEVPAKVDESFNPALYARTVIKMFDDDLPEQRVTLLCENPLMKNILDRFGEDTETEVADDSHFRAFVNVVPSSTFFGWLIQYQGGLLIEGPERIKEEYEEMLHKVIQRQQDIESKASSDALI